MCRPAPTVEDQFKARFFVPGYSSCKWVRAAKLWDWQGTSREDDVCEAAARAGGALAIAIAGAETEGRLPAGAGQVGDAPRTGVASARLLFPVDPLDRLVDGLQGDAVQRRIEMKPLPAAAGGDRLGAVVTVAHGDQAEHGRRADLSVPARLRKPGVVAGLGAKRPVGAAMVRVLPQTRAPESPVPISGGFFMNTNPARSKCSTKPLGDDLGHDLIRVVDALPALEAQREGDRIGEVGRGAGVSLSASGMRAG